MSSDDDGFILVEKKQKYKKISQNIMSNVILKREEVISKVRKIIEKYKPYAVYLYGSTARNQNKESSDVDIFVIWKNKYPNNNIIQKIYDQLYDEFQRKIDFVNYIYNGKSIKVGSSDSCFVQNVINDAVSIIEPKKNYKSMVIKEILFDYDCYYDF